MSALEPGATVEARFVPERDTASRYAEASGDLNPIHTDEEFARSVGLPGCILHGLWTMAQIARVLQEAGGGPGSLEELRLQFRGMARPGEEIRIAASARSREGDRVVVDVTAHQGETVLVRGAEAVLRA